MNRSSYKPNRAQISRAAIQKLHVSMRHLFLRGKYKPLGVSGEMMIKSMLELQPEIYGSIADVEKMELSGLLYVFQRLPQGIESCRYINLVGREGYEESSFSVIIPSKRRRNCYRVDSEQMVIEMTRGQSDIFDVLTHLTFLYIEAEKIRAKALDSKGRVTRAWKMLEEVVRHLDAGDDFDEDVGYTYLSSLIGRTYAETVDACRKFKVADKVNDLFHIVYYMGKLSMEEYTEKKDREIFFSSELREIIGHHIYGEIWAQKIKKHLYDHGLLDKEIHIISSNLHSVMNVLYSHAVLQGKSKKQSILEMAAHLSADSHSKDRDKVRKYALKNGMTELYDNNGTNITVQIFDGNSISGLPAEIGEEANLSGKVLIVMDYAFGQQAYETMDELLKPFDIEGRKIYINIASINIMGKAGILSGKKGDIMIPDAHVFEGSADNYPFYNDIDKEFFIQNNLNVFEGTMITVLGTSLQNKDILRYFLKSSWKAIGLDMEGAHYQKAVQVASKIRNSISENVKVRYAYYASDNPLKSGSTLASGSLGMDGVVPTYLITIAFLKHIFGK